IEIKETELSPEESSPESTVPANGEQKIFHPRTKASAGKIIRKKLPQDFYFNEFIVGDENKFAYEVALQVIKNPGKWNPLYLYGKTGVGKTHLLKSILREYHKRNLKARYLQGNQFFSLYYKTTRSNSYDDFYSLFSDLDLLIIDDLQFFEGKIKTQETFFHIFNSLFESGAQIILGSDRNPRNITGLEEALVSRFTWGLLIEISPPGTSLKAKIIRKKLNLNADKYPEDDIIKYFAELDITNIRDIEGIVTRLKAQTEIKKQTITKKLVKQEAHNLCLQMTRPLTINKIIKTVCTYFNISIEEITGKRRLQKFTLPRQIAIYIARQETRATYPAIGKKFGNRAHSTILNSVQKIEKLVKTEPTIQKALKEIKNLLAS
ncbi:MAG: chromosomal replication initiator protein DnaA, partial [Deltaproteobacteria bacterium]|nr:chromosomal replication initiator protein DnaA [Deltaproteobacteria bacterium]